MSFIDKSALSESNLGLRGYRVDLDQLESHADDGALDIIEAIRGA